MTQPFTLYTYELTHNPLKIQLLLNLLSQQSEPLRQRISQIEQRPIRLDKMEHRSESLRQLNPNGKLPVLQHGDFVLWESNAILQYLAAELQADADPNDRLPLWPEDHRTQADILRWLQWETGRWNPRIGELLRHQVYFPFWGYPGDPAAIEKNLPPLGKALNLLDQQLQQTPFLCGQALTIADLSVAAPLLFVDDLAITLSDFPALQRWFAALSETRWWQQTQQSLQQFRNP